MNRLLAHLLPSTVFVAALAVLAWVGAGYATQAPLALAMTCLIAVVFLAGSAELWRYRTDTTRLEESLADLPAAADDVDRWAERLPEALRPAVQGRLDGQRAALPPPALAPALSGLLVLLGMLGTFLGLVLTLRGTGLALEGATDLQAVRASLVLPVKGLGMAFGTSIAGVATSAALGVLAALARRQRARVGRALEARLAGLLRAASPARQREETLVLLQRQVDLLPAMVERMETFLGAMTERTRAADEAAAARQERLQARTVASFEQLAADVSRHLERHLAQGMRQAGEAIGPAVQTTLAALARQAGAMHERVAASTRAQLEGCAAQLEGVVRRAAEAWDEALARHDAVIQAREEGLGRALQGAAQAFEEQAGQLVRALDEQHVRSRQALQESGRAHLDASAAQLQQLADALGQGLKTACASWDAAAERMATGWQEAHARQEAASAERARAASQASREAGARLERHAAALGRELAQANEHAARAAESREAGRQAAWQDGLEAMAQALVAAWQAEGERALVRHRAIDDTLRNTAQAMASQAEAQARATVAEIGRLVEAASEAPRAAAEVMAGLREKLSQSLVQDQALLAERARMLDTVATLLEGVNRAAGEQRAAIDALVGLADSLLERAGARLEQRAEAQAERLACLAAEVSGSAAEVASLGEAFGAAVTAFAGASDSLVGQLGRIESALSGSMARGDEQFAYYVAQAREVVDLSVLSQRQILDQLARVGGEPLLAGAPA